MANLRNGTFEILANREVEGSNHPSTSTSPYGSDDEYKDALVEELCSSSDLTERLKVLIRNGARHHPQQIRDLAKHERARDLLNHLQTWLDLFPDDDFDRRRVLYTLIRTIQSAEAYPSDLFLNDIELVGTKAFDKGGYSLLYHGHWVLDLGCRRPVVLKKPTVEGETKEAEAAIVKDFIREAIVWRQLRHRHVHPLLGLYREPEDVSVIYGVSEYCRLRTLHHYVHGTSVTMNHDEEYSPSRDCLRLLAEIADGLTYLHSLKIVHCDMKPHNIVVDNHRRARILDFGSNVVGDITSGKLTTPESPRSTVQWQPPEALSEEPTIQRPRASFDVYSFACICYCISMGFKNIFNDKGRKNDFKWAQKIDKGIRPTWEQSQNLEVNPRIGIRPSNGMWSFVICPGWAQEASNRPDMKTIRNHILRERRRALQEESLVNSEALDANGGQKFGELPFTRTSTINVVSTLTGDAEARCRMAKNDHSVQESSVRENMCTMHMFMARAVRESEHADDGEQNLHYHTGELVRVLNIVSDNHDRWLAVNESSMVGEVKSSDFSLEDIEASSDEGYVGQKRKFSTRYSLQPSPSLSNHHVMSCQSGEIIEALQEPDFSTGWMAARKWNDGAVGPVQIIPTDFVNDNRRRLS